MTQKATGLKRPRGAEPARPLPLLRLGGARAGRSRRSRAASGDGSRSRWSSPRARTSSSSTSRRTTSTSRAARRSRPRSTRSRGRCSSSRTTARCSTRSPSGRSRSRTATLARLRRRLGRATSSGAEREAAPPPEARPRSRSPQAESPRATRPRRDPLADLERRVEEQETVVASLEAKLAEDWSNVDTIAAHRRARETLTALLARVGAARWTRSREGLGRRAASRNSRRDPSAASVGVTPLVAGCVEHARSVGLGRSARSTSARQLAGSSPAPGRLVQVDAARVRDEVGQREDAALVERLDGARAVRDVRRGHDRQAAKRVRVVRRGSRPAARPGTRTSHSTAKSSSRGARRRARRGGRARSPCSAAERRGARPRRGRPGRRARPRSC